MTRVYPFPSVASLKAAFSISVKRIDVEARKIEVSPWERACFVLTLDNGVSESF